MLRIYQYAYFSVYSTSMPPTDIAARIGLAADRTAVRGSRCQSGGLPVPRHHRWTVDGQDRTARLDDQVEHLVARLEPHQDRIAALAPLLRGDGEGAGCCLSVVRHFDHDEGVADGWQHHLLGWELDHRVLRFLHHVGANVDIDEYGQDDDEDDEDEDAGQDPAEGRSPRMV